MNDELDAPLKIFENFLRERATERFPDADATVVHAGSGFDDEVQRWLIRLWGEGPFCVGITREALRDPDSLHLGMAALQGTDWLEELRAIAPEGRGLLVGTGGRIEAFDWRA